jgi:hypothetical protein
MESEQKLVPILREGIEIVKVIFFKELREHLRQQQVERDNETAARLTAAVVNRVFGVENEDAAFKAFVEVNSKAIDETLASVATELAGLRIPLTDALRTMVLCDFQEEERDSSALLQQAQELGILMADRDLPLPNHFIDLVRRLGAAKGILQG